MLLIIRSEIKVKVIDGKVIPHAYKRQVEKKMRK